VTELGGGIDPLELDLLGGPAGSLGVQSLAQSHNTLLDTGNGALDHNEVVLDLTVVDETTHAKETLEFANTHGEKISRRNIRGDLLLGDVELGGGVTLISTLSNAENLVVAGGTVVVTVLTGTGNSPLDVVRVPSTNTGDLAQTLVSLAGQLGGTPTGGDTGETVTLGDGDDINHLVLLEDGVDIDGLLEEVAGEVDLVSDGATVDLDLHKVGLLLLDGSLADLGVGEHTDDSAVLLDALKLAGDGGTGALGVGLGVLGEGLLLGLVPVLVEATLDLIAQVLSPDGGERAETTGSLDVTDDTNGNELKRKNVRVLVAFFPFLPSLSHTTGETYRRSLDDGDGLDNLLLVHLGTRTVKVTDDGGHTSLVAHGGSKVDGLLGIILGEAVAKKSLSTQIHKSRIYSESTDLLTLPR
jgi:hypothetical protein